MRHRFIEWWPVLWQHFGVRPMDVDTLTLVEVLALEQALVQYARTR